jgi:hypothetical protein
MIELREQPGACPVLIIAIIGLRRRAGQRLTDPSPLTWSTKPRRRFIAIADTLRGWWNVAGHR